VSLYIELVLEGWRITQFFKIEIGLNEEKHPYQNLQNPSGRLYYCCFVCFARPFCFAFRGSKQDRGFFLPSNTCFSGEKIIRTKRNVVVLLRRLSHETIAPR
jgi:hypothetical protein